MAHGPTGVNPQQEPVFLFLSRKAMGAAGGWGGGRGGGGEARGQTGVRWLENGMLATPPWARPPQGSKETLSAFFTYRWGKASTYLKVVRKSKVS